MKARKCLSHSFLGFKFLDQSMTSATVISEFTINERPFSFFFLSFILLSLAFLAYIEVI